MLALIFLLILLLGMGSMLIFFRDSMGLNSREIVSHEISRAMEQREISRKISRMN